MVETPTLTPVPSLQAGIGAACPVTTKAANIADATGFPAGCGAWSDVFQAAFGELKPLYDALNEDRPAP